MDDWQQNKGWDQPVHHPFPSGTRGGFIPVGDPSPQAGLFPV